MYLDWPVGSISPRCATRPQVFRLPTAFGPHRLRIARCVSRGRGSWPHDEARTLRGEPDRCARTTRRRRNRTETPASKRAGSISSAPFAAAHRMRARSYSGRRLVHILGSKIERTDLVGLGAAGRHTMTGTWDFARNGRQHRCLRVRSPRSSTISPGVRAANISSACAPVAATSTSYPRDRSSGPTARWMAASSSTNRIREGGVTTVMDPREWGPSRRRKSRQ